MKIRVDIVLVYLFGLILIQQCLGDDVSGIGLSNWTCTCFASHNQSDVLASNCSTSCDCRPDNLEWTCLCPANGFPRVTTDSSNSSCFTACKCSAGPIGETKSSKKQSFPRNTQNKVTKII